MYEENRRFVDDRGETMKTGNGEGNGGAGTKPAGKEKVVEGDGRE